MNQRQREAASSTLEIHGVDAPHTEEECQRVLESHQAWKSQNSDIESVSEVRERAASGTLGYFAALTEAANEVKANRLGS